MKTVFVTSHSNGQVGGLDTVLVYLREAGHQVYVLLHPLDDYTKVPTSLEKPDGTKLVLKRTPRSIFNLFGDFWLSVKFIQRTKMDTYIGVSNFDTIPAIFCRNILRKSIPKIVYYPRDYSEDRFANKLMNAIYVQVEKFCVKYSDCTISNTERAASQRQKLGLKAENSMVIANPVKLSNPEFEPKTIKKDHFIYAGDVSREHGLYDLIEVISPLIKKLVIIGTGPDWERTIALAKRKDFELEAHGNQTHDFTVEYMKKFDGIGLAPYNLTSKWTYYCSPLKVGEYIATGLPVLMSDVPEIAKVVKDEGLGITYSKINLEAIQAKLGALNTDNFVAKAAKFYDEFNYKKVLVDVPL